MALNDMSHKTQFCHCLPNCNKVQMDTQTLHIKSAIYADICEDEDEIGWKYVNALLNNVKINELYDTMAENDLENVYKVNLSDSQAVCQYLRNLMHLIILNSSMTFTFNWVFLLLLF